MYMKYFLYILLAAAIFASGYVTGQFFAYTGFDFINEQPQSVESDTISSQTNNTMEVLPIDQTDLTPEQQAIADKYGVDTSKVTPEMVACAEAKLGAIRLDEIKNGATPTFSESLALFACYSTN